MRDPKRINPILRKFRKLWQKYPDLRFGQLVIYIHDVGSTHPDLFYIEDEAFLERLTMRIDSIL